MRRFIILMIIAGLFAACSNSPVRTVEQEIAVTPTPAPAPTAAVVPQPTPVPTPHAPPTPTQSPTSTPTPTPTLQPTPTPTPSIQEVIAEMQAYVIRIDRGDGCASGILLGRDGLVLTNYHVIRRAESLVGTTVDGTRSALEVLTFDRDRDLALLQATSTLPEPTPLLLTADSELGLGEPILVLGYPFPSSQSLSDCSESVTVTRGILSGRLDILGKAMLQTDAPLNPGVSGGLAVTDTGVVAGLAVSGLTPDIAESVGFLIPAGAIEDRLAEWLPQLEAGTLEPPQEIGRIAFTRLRIQDWTFDIFVMDADGRNIRQLTNSPARQGRPDWSPDGTLVAFEEAGNTSASVASNFDIYVISIDSETVTRVTDQGGSSPAWSPDGSQLAFTSWRDGAIDIYVMTGDGSLRQLTDNPDWERSLDWSPDGTQITFSASRDGNPDIYVMDVDGGSVRRLTDGDWYNKDPAWSPTGDLIAFVSYRDGRNNIYLMDVDGGGVRRLTDGNRPAWSPDGTRIAFSSARDGGPHIYVIDVDGGNIHQITDGPGGHLEPAWASAP